MIEKYSQEGNSRLAEIRSKLGDLGDPDTRKFEIKLGKLLAEELENRPRYSYDSLEGTLRDIAETEEEEEVSYSAQYALCLIARRSHTTDKFAQYLALAKRDNRPGYRHLRAMHFKDADRTQKGLNEAIEEIRYAIDLNEKIGKPLHTGMLHNYTEAVISMLEACMTVKDDIQKQARECAEMAVRAEPNYPKFHATLGRWYALSGDYEMANKEIYKAIQLESGWDRAYRYADYRNLLATIDISRREQDLKKRLDQSSRELQSKFDEIDSLIKQTLSLKSEIDKTVSRIGRKLDDLYKLSDDVKASAASATIRHAEMLGFFAGILALIVTATKMEPVRPGAMLVVLLALSGVLILSYVALSYLLHRDPTDTSSPHRNAFIVVASGGFILLIVALVALTLMYKFAPELLSMPTQRTDTLPNLL